MKKIKTVLLERPKEEVYSLFEVKFDVDDWLDSQTVKELFSLVDNSVRDRAELIGYCKKPAQLCIDEKGNQIYKLLDASYSFRFLGNDKTLQKILKLLQKIYPDYFIGLEKER